MKIYNLRVQLVKHAGNDMRLQFLKLLPPSIRLDCSGYSLVFPRTKPYLNTNKIRQILCCIGTQGSSTTTWICHAWLTSILSKCKKATPSITLDCSGYSLVFPRTKPYLNTNKIRQIHAVLVLKEALWLPESAMPGLHLSYQNAQIYYHHTISTHFHYIFPIDMNIIVM